MRNRNAMVRRQFLRYLLASPLWAAGFPEFYKELFAGPSINTQSATKPLIATPDDALNVFDFEDVMRDKVPPAHFGYMATGVDDEYTLRANREGFARFQIVPNRLVDVSRISTNINLFGRQWNSPIFLCPVGSQEAFHPDGERAVARAAKAKSHLQILSTQTSTSVEDVNNARGEPVWYQLYPGTEWRIAEGIVKRVTAAGCPVIVFTVDLLGGSNRETMARMGRIDTRQCNACHTPSRIRPMFRGLVTEAPTSVNSPNVTWDAIKRIRDLTPAKLLIKGIESAHDAALCVEHGVDGIIVSNHGGRAADTGRGAIEALGDVVNTVGGRIPVLVDSGFRRGTDIFKALALGATAVGIGRPYIWGLGAFGQPGVEKVIDILNRELQMVMRQTGVTSIAQINRSFVTHTKAG